MADIGPISLQSCHMCSARRGFNGINAIKPAAMKPQLVYILHSGQMFGTERMALATLRALSRQFDGVVIAPPGAVHEAAHAAGLQSCPVNGPLGLIGALIRHLRAHPCSAVVATGVAQSLLVAAIQRVLGACGPHVHVVHGGTDERLSYGRKRLLADMNVQFVAVSAFVRERLVAHGVPDRCITVIPNFLQESPVARRFAFLRPGVKRVVMLSRLDRIKRVGLLFDALERVPGLAEIQFDVYGSGEESALLKERATRWPNVHLHGYVADAASELAKADLLLHTCPEEPFGLVMLEAFAAGVPVLVPNAGGAACIVQDGVNGFHFAANNAVSLGRKLAQLMHASSTMLNAVAQGGRVALAERYRAEEPVRRYAQLLGASS